MLFTGGASASVLAAGPNVTSQLLGGGLIGLREGLEAGIVVMILVAFLVKSDRRDALKWVWLGVGAAVLMTVIAFLSFQYSAYTMTTLGAEAIAGIASVIAVIIVTTMVLWMKKAAAGMSGQLRAEMTQALETGPLAVLFLSFLAVGREGFETALFMVGFAEQETVWPLMGLVIGVLIAAVIAYGMYKGAVNVNLTVFFRITGIFLIVVAAGILSYGVHAMQVLGWLPGGANIAFDATTWPWLSWFDWSSWYGAVVGGIFNIQPQPTVLQVIVYLTYLVVVLALFLKPAKATPKHTPSSSPNNSTDPTPEPEQTSSERSNS